MSEVADLWVTLRAKTTGFTAEMAGAGAAAESSGARIRKSIATTGLLVAGGIAAIGITAVKMGSAFQASMVRVNTLAMGGKGNIQQLSNAVLGLAGQVGYSPNSLAEALYHIESNFYSVGLGGKQALDALRVAAQGAQIGGANLVDTTNALGAAVASGIPGVKNYRAAMQDLLNTVGSGDMTMQNLADAFSTGVLAVVKQYGATLKDVSASLATFGDNNIRGQVAATYLRMSIMDLTKQSKAGKAALAGIGIQSGQLARDMQSGGLDKAIIDLRAHLISAGVPAKAWGLLMEDAFTKKSSAPLAILLGQFDRLQSKYKVLGEGTSFTQAWSDRLKTFSQQWDDFKATGEAALTKLGEILLPIVTKAFEGLNTAFAWLGKHKDVLYALAGGAAALVGVGLVAWVISLVNPFTLLVVGIFAVGAGLTYLYEHSATFRNIVNALGNALRNGLGVTFTWLAHTLFPMLRTAFQVTWQAMGAVVTWFINGPVAWIKSTFGGLASFFTQHWDEIEQIFSYAWKVISTIIGGELKIIWGLFVAGTKAWWDIVSGVMKEIWTIIQAIWNNISAYIRFALNLITGIIGVALDLITGHWGRAWTDLKNLAAKAWDDFKNMCATFFNGLVSIFYGFGKNIVGGLVNGIKSAIGGAVNAVKNLGSGIGNAFKAITGIGSPSKVFHEFGLNIGQGLVNGINASRGLVHEAMTKLGTLVKETWTKGKHPKLHISWAPEHAFINKLEKSFTLDFHNLTHSREAISKFATHHKTTEGRAEALQGVARLHADILTVVRQVEHARAKILHDPHATAAERRRINTEFGQVLGQLHKANELRTKILAEQINAHKTLKAHTARRESARKAIAGDEVTYLAAAAAAGWTTGRAPAFRSVPTAAQQPLVVEIHHTTTLDGRVIYESVQKRSVRAERRNSSNLLSARRTAKR